MDCKFCGDDISKDYNDALSSIYYKSNDNLTLKVNDIPVCLTCFMKFTIPRLEDAKKARGN